MTTVFAIALGAVLFLGAMPDLLSAQTFDPQSVIGEWAGTWQHTGPQAAHLKGQYVLTVKKIEGTKAFCHVYTTSPRGPAQGEPVATLQGNRLSWGGQNATEFTISGTEMRGVRRDPAGPVEINLKKK